MDLDQKTSYGMGKLRISGDSLEIIYYAPRPARAEVTVDYSIESSVMRCLPDLNHVYGL